MKFRYKVMATNLLLLSLALGLIGYMTIRRNFDQAMDAQISNAVTENNLVQSSVEYSILQMLGSGGYSSGRLTEIGARVYGNLASEELSLYIRIGESYAYSSDGRESAVPEELFAQLTEGGKNYAIVKERGGQYLLVTSYSVVQGEKLCIVTKRGVSETYQLLEDQIAYYRVLFALVLLAVAAAVYMISRILTGALEQLDHVAGLMAMGNYDTRVHVSSSDEVGHLAESFNRMAEAVSQHVEMLGELVNSRDRFVADFTHEIKTPMTTIIGYADTLRSVELPREDEVTALNYIFSEGKRLEEMSQKLFSLIYLRQHGIGVQPLHIGNLENEIMRAALPILRKKRITLSAEMEAAILPGDQALLVTALLNLIDNARKASPECGRIELTGRMQPNGYEICVRDHGVGMTEDVVKHMCEEFYMADKSRARREGGAGIGMSLVALIVEKHGAALTVESAPGEGTAVRILFPQAKRTGGTD